MTIAVYITALVLPLAILLFDRAVVSGAWRLRRAFLVSAAAIYLLVVGSAMVQERLLDHRLSKFDLNGDGVFSGPELTPEQDAALQRVTNDTGRTFAPFTGAVFAVGYASIFFGMLSGARALGRRLLRRHGHSA
jgi:hypothetical protein